jgi:serine/threonine protein kinase
MSPDPSRNETGTLETPDSNQSGVEESTIPWQPKSNTQSTADDTGRERSDGDAEPDHLEDWPALPGYTIQAEIARGGMGRVLAAHDLTLDREVAIKTSLPGADVARFVTESKITGRLPHPCIPPVYALGALPDGSHYLVMKRIRGRTLAALLEERTSPHQDLPRFVQVFEQIAQAAGFAHSQGIIHRDLKPLNVMVGAFGEVQVMDWGLAKQLRSADCGSCEEGAVPTSQGDLTHAGAVLGTPAYMPPEQARGEIIDARADVFALGGILAAILTGQPPFTAATGRQTLAKAAAGDLSETYRRLDGCGVDRELVALAKHCLAATAQDRPVNAQSVADAVAAYRAGVEARLRDAETERAAAKIREAEQHKRRRQFRVATALIAAVLLVGLVGTSIGMLRANTATEAERIAKLHAQDQTTKAEAAAAAEKAANEVTKQRLAQIERGVELLASLLREINPRNEQLGGPPLYEVLAQRALKAADELDADSIGHPLAVARLQAILGGVLLELGHAPKAIEVLEKASATQEAALGWDHLNTIGTLQNLAAAYLKEGKAPEAITLFERIRRADTLDATHTMAILGNLAAAYREAGDYLQAISLFEQLFESQRQELGDEDRLTLTTQSNLADACFAAGRLPQAIQILEQVRDARVRTLGADHVDTLVTLNNLGSAYLSAGRIEEGVALLEPLRDTTAQKLGKEHPSSLTALNSLAAAYFNTGEVDKSIGILEELRPVIIQKLGAAHPNSITTLNNLGDAYRTAGRLPQAIETLEQARQVIVAVKGADHPSTLTTVHNLALAYLAAGRRAEALPLFEEAASGVERRNYLHNNAWLILTHAIQAYENAKSWEQAEAWHRKLIDFVKQSGNAESPQFTAALYGFGSNQLRQKKWSDAESTLRECLALAQRLFADDWRTFSAMSALGAALSGQQRHSDAEPLLLKSYEGLERHQAKLGKNAKVHLTEAIDRLIELYTALDQPDQVEKWRVERERRQ